MLFRLETNYIYDYGSMEKICCNVLDGFRGNGCPNIICRCGSAGKQGGITGGSQGVERKGRE